MRVTYHLTVLFSLNFSSTFLNFSQPLTKHAETFSSFRTEAELDYYHKKLNVQVFSRVAAQLESKETS